MEIVNAIIDLGEHVNIIPLSAVRNWGPQNRSNLNNTIDGRQNLQETNETY